MRGAKRKYRVCPRCSGEGTVVNSALSVWTRADIEDDPEAFEAMLEGRYDVPCPMCEGHRVVTRADEARYRDAVQDRRTEAMESGDYETYFNPF